MNLLKQASSSQEDSAYLVRTASGCIAQPRESFARQYKRIVLAQALDTQLAPNSARDALSKDDYFFWYPRNLVKQKELHILSKLEN
jgi:hypothetical protein